MSKRSKGFFADSIHRVEIWENNEGRDLKEMISEGILTHAVVWRNKKQEIILYETVIRAAPFTEKNKPIDAVDIPDTALLRFESTVDVPWIERLLLTFKIREDLCQYAQEAHWVIYSECNYGQYKHLLRERKLTLRGFLELGGYRSTTAGHGELKSEVCLAGYGEW